MKNSLLEDPDLGSAPFMAPVMRAVDRAVVAHDVHPAGRNMVKCCLIGGIRLGQAAELASSFPEIKSLPSPEANRKVGGARCEKLSTSALRAGPVPEA